jgi:hypothetical protein
LASIGNKNVEVIIGGEGVWVWNLAERAKREGNTKLLEAALLVIADGDKDEFQQLLEAMNRE